MKRGINGGSARTARRKWKRMYASQLDPEELAKMQSKGKQSEFGQGKKAKFDSWVAFKETKAMSSLDIRVILEAELPAEERVLMAREDLAVIMLGELQELKEAEEARVMQQEDKAWSSFSC